VDTADGEGQERENSLVHTSFEVNAYLAKGKGDTGGGAGTTLDTGGGDVELHF